MNKLRLISFILLLIIGSSYYIVFFTGDRHDFETPIKKWALVCLLTFTIGVPFLIYFLKSILLKYRLVFGFIPAILIFLYFYMNHTVNVFSHRICADGSISYSESNGACSWHGGVSETIYKHILVEPEPKDIFLYIFISIFLGGIPLGVILYELAGKIYNSFPDWLKNLGE